MDNDRNAPATKGDVQDVKLELGAEMKAMEDRLVEAFRDGQTELLKAFYNYAQSNDERVASTEADAASLKKRLAIAESRITDIERRLNWPPPTQTH
jgi:hypothetical protein